VLQVILTALEERSPHLTPALSAQGGRRGGDSGR
jgi:hypothetical protein